MLTTATNRVTSKLTAANLGDTHLIATDCAVGADGRFTGTVAGVANMGAGKLARLHAWLVTQGRRLEDEVSVLNSDSANDLPLLRAVRQAVAVDPDAALATQAKARGWPVVALRFV